jgi:hypothetical protein
LAGHGSVAATGSPAQVALEAAPLNTGAGGPGSTATEGPQSSPTEESEDEGAGLGGGGKLPIETGETVNDPIDPRFLTAMRFGSRSFWLQPWRAYLDTWPSSHLLDAVGINFNPGPHQSEATAQLLHDSGFRLARMSITWAALSYNDQTSFLPEHLHSIAVRLIAMKNHGLRPLITLQAYTEHPSPWKHVVLETIAPALAGATTVALTPASAAEVVPGKTGFNGLLFGGAPDELITSVDAAGVATLARPLVAPLASGPHPGTTLLYAPFVAPKLANGTPNPQFQATLSGWLNYVAQVSKLAANTVGPGGYDLEVWNELLSGSTFLNPYRYYVTGTGEAPPASPAVASPAVASPASVAASTAAPEGEAEAATAAPGSGPEEGGPEASYSSESGPDPEGAPAPVAEEGAEDAAPMTAGALAAAKPTPEQIEKNRIVREIRRTLLSETVAFVRNPANGISPNVGITNGFASQTPFPSGAAAPIGLTALSKHPYHSVRDFPAADRTSRIVPLNALGLRDTVRGSFTPLFVPTYQSLLPEYSLTGTATETLVRDLAPFTTYVYKFPHGRNVGPPGGSPVQKWITEYNLIPGNGTVMGPDGVTPQNGGAATLAPADKRHFDAKVVLRSLVSMVNKGANREYFFASGQGAFSLIGESFYNALEVSPGTYPGDQLGGETMDGMRNMLAHFQGPGPSGETRQLKLLSITQEGNHSQFTGDGTPAHPDLHDRDVLAVLPFQDAPNRFVIPVYVMTRNLLTLYQPSALPSDITRFDLPAENFKITLGGLPETSTPPTVSSYDPLTNQTTPAQLVSRSGESAVVEVSTTDYPRLLTIEYPGS